MRTTFFYNISFAIKRAILLNTYTGQYEDAIEFTQWTKSDLLIKADF